MEIKIGNKKIQVPSDWSDLTLKKVASIAEKTIIPKELARSYELALKGEIQLAEEAVSELPYEDYLKFIVEFSESICIGSNGYFAKATKDTVVPFYEVYLRKFAIGIYLQIPYENEEVVEMDYDFNGEQYSLPKYKMVGNSVIPMGYSSTKQFSDAFDLHAICNALEQGKWASYNIVVACMLRKEGEDEYDTETRLARAEEMSEITMDVVWQVFFYFGKLTMRLLSSSPTFLEALKIMEKLTSGNKLQSRKKDGGEVS